MKQNDEALFFERIGEVRKEIDEIDSQLIPLLIARMECSRKVATIKQQAGKPVYDPKREQSILDALRERSGEYGDSLSVLYANIMSVSRARQHAIINRDGPMRTLVQEAKKAIPDENSKVICQGVEGAYSHKAAKKFFGGAGDISFTPAFEEVFYAVEQQQADFGVLPVENSAAGSVSEVYNLLIKYRLFIAGACTLRVRHCIARAKGTGKVKRVISHQQALWQCAEYIHSHQLQEEAFSNTAAAAKYVMEAKEEGLGAICSTDAAKAYGLEIIETDIQNEKQNATRFVLVSKVPILPEKANKISLCFSLPHQAGSLYHVLENFSANGLSLTKIESCPIPERQFEYDFYLDFTGNIHQEKTLNLICALHDELPRFSFLGNYPETEEDEEA